MARTKLILEVEPGTEPIEGLVHDGDGPAREFVGWLGLAAALEAVMRPAEGAERPGAVEEAATS